MTNAHNDTYLPVIDPPVWFITGCSTGFGHELARQAIERGHRVVITARDPASVSALAITDKTLVLALDVTQLEQVAAAVDAAEAHFGRIDVLVNNAGIGYFGAVEESQEAEVRKMFEVNVFGLGRMVQAVLPGMRRRQAGTIINVSSLAGLRSFPAIGYYSATKFAVEGLSDALRQEVEPLGIQVMVVEPSGFRTDWAGRSANESPLHISDYMATAGNGRNQLRAHSGQQPGDPHLAAHAILEAVASGHPPRHLLLGGDAFEGAMAKLDELRQAFTEGEGIARAADLPLAPAPPQRTPAKGHPATVAPIAHT
jgi:NAD(P)-dependent dehydrogenase (short-subunit alcohol dehydrogenase family)